MKAALAVAVAANMMTAMRQIAPDFKAESGVELQLTQGSSGRFAAQIRGGAPFDVFISADMDYPRAVEAAGLAGGPATPYAYGQLIVWTMGAADVSSLKALAGSDGKIAIADPRLAPYGRAAVEALKNAGVYDAVEGRLVYGESVSQVNQFIASGAAAAGLTARSIVETDEWRGKGRWTAVDSSLHAPIEQGLIVTKTGRERAPEAARSLRAYLLGPKGRAVLEKEGYLLPPERGVSCPDVLVSTSAGGRLARWTDAKLSALPATPFTNRGGRSRRAVRLATLLDRAGFDPRSARGRLVVTGAGSLSDGRRSERSLDVQEPFRRPSLVLFRNPAGYWTLADAAPAEGEGSAERDARVRQVCRIEARE